MLNAVEPKEIEIGSARSWSADAGERSESGVDWREVDRALRAIRHRRAALDAEEARWLREAEALQIWRPLGMVSALDYMERVLGYAPRTAQDRLRVARALGDLPRLTAALAADELAFSAVRELTRVATPATEASWIAAAAGKNLRQIEELVADHRPGDRPDDPPDPRARTHVVRFELAAETFALLREARRALDDEHGVNLPDDGFVAALCGAALEGETHSEPSGRAKFQIAVTVCERCRQGWQHGAGARVAIEASAVDRAMCDAQHVGSIDGAAPERAHQDVPPSTVRLVWRRDGGRCRVPGCRSARGLEIHHLVHRVDGGRHDASNLALLCSACHLAHHRGALTISGTAEQLTVDRPGQVPRAPGDEPSDRVPRQARARAAPPDEGRSGHDRARRASSTPPGVAGGASRSTQTRAGLEVSGDGAAVQPEAASDAVGNRIAARWRSTADTGRAGGHGPVSSAGCSRAHVGEPGRGAVAVACDPIRSVSKLDMAILRTQARAALTGLGWKPAIAHAAVAAAEAAQGADPTLERWIFESLRRCPAPKP